MDKLASLIERDRMVYKKMKHMTGIAIIESCILQAPF